MSKSRLEKFLYALYSLDSSDLPNPLSRIEQLYKCWVTGEEAPTLKPLSRVEKYLMAILGLYDLETQVEQRVLCTENNDVIVDENENRICLDEVTSGGIPAPISRIEKLLYKLATGDDNLDDFKSFLSEHEELLAEIIRNGGVGGNIDIDIEYVLYTLSTEFNKLYNTAEKPVKSAILSGNTLVNLVPSNYSIDIQGITTAWGHSIFLYSPNKGNDYDIESLQSVKSNTKYLLRFYVEKNTVNNKFAVNNPSDDSVFSSYVGVNPGETGWFNFVLTSKEIVSEYIVIRFQNANTTNGDIKVNKIMLIEYQDGMENWDIPYFEGMQSVKMPVLNTTGKNLFNPNWKLNTWYPFKVKSGTKLTLSTKDSVPSNGGNIRLKATDETDIWLGINEGTTIRIITLQKDVYKLSNMLNGNIEYQLEIGDKTPYEPFKSNILAVNEDVVLCGIGDVKDELDLLTGELVQKTEKIIFDGSEAWEVISSLEKDNTIFAQCYKYTRNNTNAISNMLDYRSSLDALDKRGFRFNHFFQIRLNKNEISNITNNAVKEWVSKNNINVVRVEEQTVKTVDLSIVDQDGNSTKLSTFNDITHVTLSSEGLIPEAELEVATKNEEVLSTLSLEMDDISTTQNDLQETSNTQSENVDATMIATTEIYEELL